MSRALKRAVAGKREETDGGKALRDIPPAGYILPCETVENYPGGNNGNGGLDGGINYNIELNERLLSQPAPFFQTTMARLARTRNPLAVGDGKNAKASARSVGLIRIIVVSYLPGIILSH